MPKEITIPQSEYLSLLKDSSKLSYLEMGGVDNWEWYSDSLNLKFNDKNYWEEEEELEAKYKEEN